MSKPDTQELHYHLHVYVCGAGCVKLSPIDGAATFAQIFQLRPNDCRFAIVQGLGLFVQQMSGPYLCLDMYHDSLLALPLSAPRRAPPPTWTSDSLDGLIMKAMVFYDRTDTK